MKYTINRGSEVNTRLWRQMNERFKNDLDEIVLGNVSEKDVLAYITEMVADMKGIGEINGLLFWAYDRPGTMPSDARVDFVYEPTYIAATILITAYCRYESVRNNEELTEAFGKVLGASMGRSMAGHGYDAEEGFVYAMSIFAKGDTMTFINEYQEVNPNFCKFIKEYALPHLQDICSGNVEFEAFSRDCSEEAKEVWAKLEGASDEDSYVWYVSYGSNLLSERMNYYIHGGVCYLNNRKYDGCEEKIDAVDSKSVIIPYDMYYANSSGSWNGSAVSFLDVSKEGRSYGRAYKIKKSQLNDIHRQEGMGVKWYPDCVRLADIDGVPAYTFTNKNGRPKKAFNEVKFEYGVTLYRGLKESYPEMSEEEIMGYLRKCGE